MEGTVAPFIKKSLDVNDTLLNVFNDRLGLPPGTLAKKHPRDEWSGSESRVTKNPPTPGETKVAIGSHTDFGSLVRHIPLAPYYSLTWLSWQSFLHNRLGGLQVFVPGAESWQYVKARRLHDITPVLALTIDFSPSPATPSVISETL